MKFGLCIHPVARKISPGALLLFLCVIGLAQSFQPLKLKDPLDRESPQSSVYAFLQAAHAHDYDKAAKYLDLGKLPSDQRLKNGPKLAQQLQQILDRDAQFDVASLSADTEGSRERVDSFTVNGQTLDLELARTKLRSRVYVWLFSSDSVERIPQIVRLTSDSPVEKHLPDPLVSWKIVDTPAWRVLGLVLLALALGALSRLLSRFALLCSEPLLKRILPKVNRSVFAEFVGPLAMLLAVVLFRAGMIWFEPSPKLHLYLTRALTVLFFAALFWLSVAVVNLSTGRLRVALREKHQGFYSVLPLASRITKLIILALMIVAVLSSWGYNTTTILAGLGVGGIAIALAAQKTIENLFGGVSIISDRPVSVGDYCKFGDKEGTVEDIGLRSTRLRAPDRTLVTVPNGQFSSMTIENISARDKLLFHFTLNLHRDTTPDQIRMLLTAIKKILTENPKLEAGAASVYLGNVGKESVDLEMSAYVLTRNGDEYTQIKQDLYLRILDVAEAAGTSVAPPPPAAPPASNGQPALQPAASNNRR
ncbi:MAG TPA: mechanosensitive ion channel family protein [Bryobacteraceae bacterium]|jgi:MscS family membrane protein|nr:mechanosensitive ion channel family protein [Bryobacteraceae bacterium]